MEEGVWIDGHSGVVLSLKEVVGPRMVAGLAEIVFELAHQVSCGLSDGGVLAWTGHGHLAAVG